MGGGRAEATLPSTGFVRLTKVLEHIPVSRATWWNGVRSGRYPRAYKIGPNTTAWRAQDIHALIAKLEQEAA